ncbi:TetR/AcrR family transcriptional regulator [Portibacter lacus]|uniref:TetR family transcriptional regulator n=1 Tax=Portibacter lacus TaxID=1099794 RepID=A0AA37SXF3_9BACT|nr:TetR/AcrR family transcriptional regulator [Portibacter lacus]GLR19490.1 TetR family transcriptional regulator [Portibacter lacus]
MVLGIKFKMIDSLYTRDPQDTDLGKKIIKNSILLIDEIGFESFNFKKLAAKIGSAEKSIYRYFDNKHLLLLFLTSWYWEWVHYLINVNVKQVSDPKRKLNIVIENIVLATHENTSNEYINENILHRVIIKEGAKAYHTFDVDDENKVGLFYSYKSLTQTVSEIILEVNPNFKYPLSLASNFIEMANNQFYFAKHLPRLTNIKNCDDMETDLVEMLNLFADKLLK